MCVDPVVVLVAEYENPVSLCVIVILVAGGEILEHFLLEK